MKRGVWLSYDLGVDGDYSGLYRWLDDHKANECGDSVAYFKFEATEDLVEEIRGAIEQAVELKKRDRIYVVYTGQDGKPHGKFLVGSRRRAAWEGYGSTQLSAEDEPE